jgi:hypothetical protein
MHEIALSLLPWIYSIKKTYTNIYVISKNKYFLIDLKSKKIEVKHLYIGINLLYLLIKFQKTKNI